MPELPEVETVVRTLENQIINQKINKIKVFHGKLIENYDYEKFSKELKYEQFLEFDRRGKWLIFKLTNHTLCVHLRMEGKFFVLPKNSNPLKHTMCLFELDDVQLQYNDTRMFGKFYLYKNDENLKCLENLGYEPWDENLTSDYLLNYCKNKKMAIKSQLLDQKMISCIGNIYSCEICYDCKINPHIPAKEITKKQWDKIIKSTRKILEQAIINKGTTIRTYTSSLGVSGGNQFSLKVYDKKGCMCKRCGKTIIREEINQRGTYWCPGCQK